MYSLLYSERKNVCSPIFLNHDGHGFASGFIQPFLESGETFRVRFYWDRFVGAMARFYQPGWRRRAGGGRQLLPSRQSFGNFEPDEFLGWNGEAHILRVVLRPRGNADDFTAIVEDRTPLFPGEMGQES